MKLIECYIENFGKLSRFSYHFTDGLNIFCRENGWGKSTFTAFIKAMFYGFGDGRAATEHTNERRQYLPWQGGKYGGTLTFTTGDEIYRVERYFDMDPSQDTFVLYDCKTGLTSTAYTHALGAELFGIDAEGYERSTFISEHLTADVRADYTGIQAKLVDMKDVSDYRIAERTLSQKQALYRTANGQGTIAQTTATLNARRTELAEAEKALQKTNELNKRVHALDEKRNTLEKELRDLHTRMDTSIGVRTAEALTAHKEGLESGLSKAREAVSACRAYLSARIPTPAELEEMGTYWRLMKDTAAEGISKRTLPSLIPICLYIAGMGCIGGSVALGVRVHPLYWLITILGMTLLGLGVTLQFMKYHSRQTIHAIKAARAEHDRMAASLAAFLTNYPIVMADTSLHDDGERLWAIRAKIDELRRAMRAEEDASAAYTDFRRKHPSLFGDAPAEVSAELTSAKVEEERIIQEIDHVREARAACEREIATHASNAGRYTTLSQEISRLEEQKRTQEKSLDILCLTRQFLASARNALTSRYLDDIQDHFRAYMRILTEVDRDSVFSDEYTSEGYTVTPDFCVNMTKFGKTHSADTLSRGGRDLVALCLRFAITDALFEGKKPPLILDDPFINLDDSKIGAAMALLTRVAEERQIFYVSCHSSRA